MKHHPKLGAHLCLYLLTIFGVVPSLELPMAAQAINGIEYISDNGSVTITGYNCGGNVDVQIPSAIDGMPVVRIGDRAFYGCQSLVNVTIPSTVTTIGHEAFYQCVRLVSITVPNGVGMIGRSAFYQCGLTNLSIGNSLTSIGDNAFVKCTGLVNVTIPNSVTQLGSGAFSGCSGLVSVNIGNGVANLNYVFNACNSLSRVDIGSGVTRIGSWSFAGCSSLTSLTIPSSVRDIEQNAFYRCYQLQSIYFNGNAPRVPGPPQSPFTDTFALQAVFYLPGTTGWANFSNITGIPVFPNPQPPASPAINAWEVVANGSDLPPFIRLSVTNLLANASYQLQTSKDVPLFSNAGAPFVATNTWQVLNVPLTNAQGFSRILQQP